jgi:hypothetical protein
MQSHIRNASVIEGIGERQRLEDAQMRDGIGFDHGRIGPKSAKRFSDKSDAES